MDLLPTDEQEAIAASARDVLTKHGYPGSLRSLDRSGHDAELWEHGTAQGWLGLGVPEDAGGLGLGATDEVMLFREIGRHLAPGALVSTVIATHAAVALGDGTLAARLVVGEERAALAVATGQGLLVLHRPGATAVVVIGGGVRLATVAALGQLEDLPGLDAGTPVARSSARADIGRAVPAPVELRLHLLASAALAGIAEATRDQAASYAAVRHQFGQPIGAFQAVKHRCADMATRAEAAWAQTCFAAAAIDGGRPDAAHQVAAAAVVAASAGRTNAAANVQVHGGIGFTAEHDAHLFVKRAHVWETVLGGRRAALHRVLDHERADD